MAKENPSWQKVKLGDLFELKYGFGLTEKNRKNGNIPVYGSSGVVGYHNEAKIEPSGIIVGRKGNVGSINYSEVPFYPIDTVYYIDKLKRDGDLKFFYYFLKTIPFAKIGSDVGVPGLNRDIAYGLDVKIPEKKSEQSHIASILSTFDDKIELNNKINATLEKMAQAIFKEWFVKFNFPVVRYVNAPPPPEGGDRLEKPKVVNSADKILYAQLEEKAKEMRNNPTEAEAILWEELRDNKLGVKFRRQHVISQFIADFYCVSAGLIIEVDGEAHKHQQERDHERDSILQSSGCKILRFKNEEILRDLPYILQKIATTITPPVGGKGALGDLGALGDTGMGYRASGGEMVDSELGKIPKGWEIKQLGDVAEIRYGKDLPTKELLLEGFPVYGGNGVIGYTNKFLFEAPQIIVGCRGAYSGNVFKTDPKCFVTHNSLVLHADELSTDFLFYSLLRSNVKSTVTGSAQPQITINELSNLPLIIPCKDILDKFEILIKSIEDKRYILKQENQKLSKLRDLLLPKLMKGEVRV